MFESLFGLPLAARFFIAFLVVLALIGVTAWVVRRFGASRLGGGARGGRQPRLAVIDAASVDGRRRLVLIRRDNIEHLLMIGGPSDVAWPHRAAAVSRSGARHPAGRHRLAVAAAQRAAGPCSSQPGHGARLPLCRDRRAMDAAGARRPSASGREPERPCGRTLDSPRRLRAAAAAGRAAS